MVTYLGTTAIVVELFYHGLSRGHPQDSLQLAAGLRRPPPRHQRQWKIGLARQLQGPCGRPQQGLELLNFCESLHPLHQKAQNLPGVYTQHAFRTKTHTHTQTHRVSPALSLSLFLSLSSQPAAAKPHPADSADPRAPEANGLGVVENSQLQERQTLGPGNQN